jgi:hypothetical protein
MRGSKLIHKIHICVGYEFVSVIKVWIEEYCTIIERIKIVVILFNCRKDLIFVLNFRKKI